MFNLIGSRIRAFAISVALFPILVAGSASAGMNDYCQVPPYVIQNVPPTIMILMDISGSMFDLAYRDGFATPETDDDASCTTTNVDNSSSRACLGYNPNFDYYGYFDSNYWYTYGSGTFTRHVPKPGSGLSGSQAKTSTDAWWDGNLLNWMTMRRIDIIRKVLTGGKPVGGTILGEIGDCNGRGKYFRVENAENYTPYSGTKIFDVNPSNRATCDGGGSGNGEFCDSSNCNNANKFNVKVAISGTPAGVLQNRVKASARVGLAFFRTSEGGYVQTVPTGTSMSAVINQINLTRPNANTPLGEALWTVAGYFSQTTSIPGFTTPAGSGPRYANGDYTTNLNNDPLNYGTGGAPRHPYCAKSFVLLLTDGEPCQDGNLPTNLLGYTVGRSDFNCTNSNCPSTSGTGFSFPNQTLNACNSGSVAGIEDVALWMHTNDLRNSPTVGTDNIAGPQNLTLYTVAAFAPNSTLLKYATINGGFEDIDGDGSPNATAEWDKDGNGVPDTYYEAREGNELEGALDNALSSMLKRASSGTAASVLASGEGSGANLLQAIFYPRRSFGNDIIGWTGSLQNLWYFVDPFFANASIREETTVDGKLNLANDDIAEFYFDEGEQKTQVNRFVDATGNGTKDTLLPYDTVSFEAMKSLWEAGKLLHARNLDTNPRAIRTQLDGVNLYDFTTANAGTLAAHLLESGDNVTKLIRYVHGYDDHTDADGDGNPDYRNRTVSSSVTDNSVWKLGDVVDSTPRVVAGIPLNKYDSAYQDSTYRAFILDNAYKSRGMAFVGGNDGMLHAFKMGKLELNWSGQATTEKGKLTNLDPSVPLGTEQWAFIPKNALPYLKYLKEPDYCHLYYVDLAPYAFDASIGNGSGDQSDEVRTQASWRTVLIGGMRFGGACANSCTSGSDCVQTPANDKGFSSYFALDVTDPESPSLLWEFSDPSLGFATTGPAVIRIHGKNAGGVRLPNLNGEWYVVLGSGPTGPIDNNSLQFLARSNQNLKYFVLNLKTGDLVQTIDTGIQYAFGGSMINTTADVNLDYQDDAVYVGYTKRAGSAGAYSWTNGGIGRILTGRSGVNVTPSNSAGAGWTFSKVIDDVGPVTTAVSRLQNNVYHSQWLYFGTGRFFYAQPPAGTSSTPTIDDADGQRRLVAVKEPCFTESNTLNFACSTTVTFPSTADTNFPNVTNVANAPTDTVANGSAFKGWYVNLDPTGNFSYDNATSYFRAERVITDPLASTSGLVFFTSFKPYGQECGLGGKSFIWALRYNTGGAPAPAALKGKALVQVSTASVEQVDMSSAFSAAAGEAWDGLHKGGRRSFSIEGVPPTAQGLSLLLPPPPVNRILHMKER